MRNQLKGARWKIGSGSAGIAGNTTKGPRSFDGPRGRVTVSVPGPGAELLFGITSSVCDILNFIRLLRATKTCCSSLLSPLLGASSCRLVVSVPVLAFLPCIINGRNANLRSFRPVRTTAISNCTAPRSARPFWMAPWQHRQWASGLPIQNWPA